VRAETFDVVIVGAGFAGMYMLHRLRGLGMRAHVFERGGDVGGTWYWNRYPGARCDIESVEYSYQFSKELEQDWDWSERYSGQPEILRYANHVADRFDLRRDITFNAKVTAATFDEAINLWRVETERGDKATARFVVMATGSLSAINMPNIAGVASFKGNIYHTGDWPQDGVDFGGKRVGIIGTGSSGIQAIPVIARQAKELVVFQRTPQYSLPSVNRALDAAELDAIKADYPGLRARNADRPSACCSRMEMNDVSVLDVSAEEREREFERHWNDGGGGFVFAYNDIMTNPEANAIVGDFVRRKIKSIVQDPDVAAMLMPTYAFGCKRLCLDTGYFETFNRPNVRLVDVRKNPITEITSGGLSTGGQEYALDSIVFATGYDAMTGALLGMNIQGRGGLPLRQAWAAGPRTYLGLGVAGFPNMFILAGPGSPSVLSLVIASIEQQIDWLTDCLRYMNDKGYHVIEAERDAQDSWVDHVNAVAAQTLYPSCNSWYVGANVPGKTRVFMPLIGFPPYVQKCNDVAAAGYTGFTLAA